MPLCWLRSAAGADAGAQSGGCRVARRWSGAGYADAEIGGWLQERLQLIHAPV